MISLVTAYYQNEDMTVEFLDNLVDKLPKDCEVILVNAGSKPIKHSIVTKRVDLKQNHSFANSMNRGMDHARGDYVCVIGNDVFPQEAGWLGRLVEDAKLSKAWIVAPANNLTDMSNYNPQQVGASPYHCTVDMFPAVCWLLPRKTLKKIGYFDERFEPGCYEDDDYVRRVRNAGGSLLVDTSVRVEHLLSKTLDLLGPNEAMAINHKRYIEKWGTP